MKVSEANEKIAHAYRRRLLEVAGFKYSPKPLPLQNSLGATIYYLFFASPNPTADEIARFIFGKHSRRS